MAKEKVITKSVPTTIVMCNLVSVNKETAEVSTSKTSIDLAGHDYDTNTARIAVIPLLETHTPTLDTVVTSVEILTTCWTLRAMPLSDFLARSSVIRTSTTYEGLRPTTGGTGNE